MAMKNHYQMQVFFSEIEKTRTPNQIWIWFDWNWRIRKSLSFNKIIYVHAIIYGIGSELHFFDISVTVAACCAAHTHLTSTEWVWKYVVPIWRAYEHISNVLITTSRQNNNKFISKHKWIHFLHLQLWNHI